MILYEAHDAWGDGIWVGFADGHLERLGRGEQDRFRKLLAAACAATQPAKRPAE